MMDTYGKVLYSIPIDLDLGCPNRKSDGSGGCTFCPQNGARSAQSLDAKSIEEQIHKSVAFAKRRYKAEHFMLYIQAYTGTFTTLSQQKETYSKLLKFHDFDAISIGTRPDCLSDETLKYLQELNKEIDVIVDLGVQTLNDETLKKINRGHDSKCSLEAIQKLQSYGIKIFAHVIVGLPNENRCDWEHTVKKLVTCKVDGIKIHNLHVIKNTQLHDEYTKRKFKIFDEYEYAEELIYLLRLIPSNIPIIRIATDTPNKDLIAPLWYMEKGQFGEYIVQAMQYRYGKADTNREFWSEKYKDFYYPRSGAKAQAKKLFIDKSDLQKRLTCKDVKLLDIGFGYGINSLEAIKLKKKNSLHVKALDQDRSILKEADNPLLHALYEKSYYSDENNSLEFIVGDIRYSLRKLDEKFDVIFLDPFSEDKNPSMVSIEVFKILHDLLHEDGVLVCSTSLHTVRVALSQAGFKSQIVTLKDIKGLVATKGYEHIEGVPYSDPYLVYTDKQIAKYREHLKA